MSKYIEKEFYTSDMTTELNKMAQQGYKFVMVKKQTKDGDGFWDSEWGGFIEYPKKTTAIFEKKQ